MEAEQGKGLTEVESGARIEFCFSCGCEEASLVSQSPTAFLFSHCSLTSTLQYSSCYWTTRAILEAWAKSMMW